MKTNTREKSSKAIATAVKIGILGALAAAVMMLEFPIVVIAPSFYEMDFSEVIVLLGGFSMGPAAAAAIEAIKIIVNLLLGGSTTVGVGELANFLIGCSLVVPASLIYKYKKTRKSAFIGLAAGTVLMVAVGCLLNAYVLLPTYAKAFGVDLQSFIDMGAAINSRITNVATFAILAVAPFNLLKGVLSSAITLLLYKKISPILKKY